MEEKKDCKNCGYYVQHYVKQNQYLFMVECGHCVNRALFKKFPKEFGKIRENCIYWEPQNTKKEKRRKNIQETLRDMEKSLEDIKIILQSDEE